MGTFDRYENFKINKLGYFRELIMKMSEFEKMTSESMLCSEINWDCSRDSWAPSRLR